MDQPSNQAAHDRLSPKEEIRLAPMVREGERVLECRQYVATHEPADNGGRDHPPPRLCIDHITAAALTRVEIVPC